MLNELKNQVIKAIQSAGYSIEPEQVRLEATKTLEHGHFALNVAMILAKKAGENPREVAQKIAANLKESPFEKVEIAGPGFINLFIEQNFYSKIVCNLAKSVEVFLKSEIEQKGQTALIDYSSPNIAKPLGIHHLLSTVIGDSIKKLYRRMGWKVVADNYLGDIGTQFGKLIYAIKTWGNTDQIEKIPSTSYSPCMCGFTMRPKKTHPSRIWPVLNLKKFEDGDQENRIMWKRIVTWSMVEINQIYERLGVEFDEMNGESFYEDKMPAF
ncbi:arginine--tRNA ligase [Candidatus Peregrinibacteria bacterium]|nr:MAG: arginine--tRNA ligase [Candidatus Peregrinibacteria bacterium]